MNAKFRDSGKPFGRAEFDKLLGDYDVSGRDPGPMLGSVVAETLR